MHDDPMQELEQALAGLDAAPPPTLARNTLLAAGVSDEAALTESPIGPLWVAWNTRGVTGVSPVSETATFEEFAAIHRREVHATERLPEHLAAQLAASLNTGVTDVPIDLSGLGRFQQLVLGVCARIPVGEVRTYHWIASEIGKPGASRAVGTALSKNPIPLLIPCHRVVRSDGTVGQYAFGAETKHNLLVREGALLA